MNAFSAASAAANEHNVVRTLAGIMPACGRIIIWSPVTAIALSCHSNCYHFFGELLR